MTDSTSGGPRPSTTDAEVRTMRCAQCATCVNGPEPETQERVIDLDGAPLTVRYPRCLIAGHLYPRARMAVCLDYKEWTP